MLIRETRRLNLFAQSLAYLIAGLFLLGYAQIVQATNLFLGLGSLLCLLSFLFVITSIYAPKCLRKIEKLDLQFKMFLLAITFFAFVMGLVKSTDLPLFEIRFMIGFSWMALIIGSSLILGIIAIVKSLLNMRIGDKKIFFYKLSKNISLASLFMGFAIIISNISENNIISKPANLNEWVTNPFVYFAIAILLVFPILALNPDKEDKEEDSKS